MRGGSFKDGCGLVIKRVDREKRLICAVVAAEVGAAVVAEVTGVGVHECLRSDLVQKCERIEHDSKNPR